MLEREFLCNLLSGNIRTLSLISIRDENAEVQVNRDCYIWKQVKMLQT